MDVDGPLGWVYVSEFVELSPPLTSSIVFLPLSQ